MRRAFTWPLFLMMLFMNFTLAETSKTFLFQNQREEIFNLENWLKETRQRSETIDSTCYRQEAYTENVCRNVTKYRQDCRTIPGHQECSTVYDRICRTEDSYETVCHTRRGEPICRVVVRYREECSSGRGERQCRTIPGDIECHRDRNGENRCVKIPPREECSEGPGRRECRNVPYEERECTDGPSRQECREERRPHEVCTNEPRQQCVWVPDEVVCQQIPYEVRECKDEILYRQIPYACKKEIQVPYEVTLKTHQANIQVLFDTQASNVASQYLVTLNTKGDLDLKGKALGTSKAVAFVKKDIKTKAEAGDVNAINAIYKIALFDSSEIFEWMDKGIMNVELHKRALSFVVQGKLDVARAKLRVKIEKKDEIKIDKILSPAQFTAKFDGAVTRVDVDLASIGTPKLGGVFNKKHTVTLKLSLDYGDIGDVLLPALGEIATAKVIEVEVD